jgi:hypothetical protein
MTEVSDETMHEIRQNVPRVFEAWAPSHTDGSILTFRPFDSDDQYQRVENVRIEPDISFELAQQFGKAGVGETAYEKLCTGFTEFDVVKTAMERHKQQKNTIISTLHLRNVIDTPATHNALFVASGGDPELAAINDIIANPMLAYTNIGELAVFRVLSASGGIDLALPYRGAKKYGMIKPARQYLARRMREGLDTRLEQGVVIHWALTQTRGVPIITKEGAPALAVSPVEQALAEYAVEQSFLGVPVPIDLQVGDSHLEVLEPRPLESVTDVHKMTEEMVEVASRLSGTEIYYGMPEGAIEAKKV